MWPFLICALSWAAPGKLYVSCFLLTSMQLWNKSDMLFEPDGIF